MAVRLPREIDRPISDKSPLSPLPSAPVPVTMAGTFVARNLQFLLRISPKFLWVLPSLSTRASLVPSQTIFPNDIPKKSSLTILCRGPPSRPIRCDAISTDTPPRSPRTRTQIPLPRFRSRSPRKPFRSPIFCLANLTFFPESTSCSIPLPRPHLSFFAAFSGPSPLIAVSKQVQARTRLTRKPRTRSRLSPNPRSRTWSSEDSRTRTRSPKVLAIANEDSRSRTRSPKVPHSFLLKIFCIPWD